LQDLVLCWETVTNVAKVLTSEKKFLVWFMKENLIL
jgi:hypothetical protein